MIEPHDLNFTENPVTQHSNYAEGTTLREAKDKIEKNMIISIIDKHKGNIAKAATELGISRPTLYDLMKKHDIYTTS